jgi:hypothetical protein
MASDSSAVGVRKGNYRIVEGILGYKRGLGAIVVVGEIGEGDERGGCRSRGAPANG